jgi:hypothetical protein
VTSAVKKAGEKALDAGATDVEVFIEASRVSSEAVLNGPISNVLKEQTSLKAVNILTKDGWVRFIR